MQNVTASSDPIERALRIRDVCSRTGISRTHLYRLVSRGQFPAPVRLSDRVTVWREHDVQSWLSRRFAAVRAVAGDPCGD